MNDEIRSFIVELKKLAGQELKFMEVCGTHTMAISRSGIRSALKPVIKFVSGPGCPVCVTDDTDIDKIFQIAEQGATILTFGDMMKVPVEKKSLYTLKSEGYSVKIVYSPCLLYTSPSPRDLSTSRMPSSA